MMHDVLAGLRVSTPTVCRVATYPPGATYGPRNLRDFEFVWIVEGEVEFHWGDRIFFAPPGTIILCRPGATDFFQWDRHNRTRHGYFHFNIAASPEDWPPVEDWPLLRPPHDGDIL